MYVSVFLDCIKTLREIFKSAQFLFFSVVSISISTMGIWIPVQFELDISGGKNGAESIGYENIAVFMYVVSVLGTIAAEYFNKRINDDVGSGATQSFAMLIWFLAIVLSFWALKEPSKITWHLLVSMWLTISLWMSFTIHKDKGEFTEEAKKALSGNGNGNGNVPGAGLTDD